MTRLAFLSCWTAGSVLFAYLGVIAYGGDVLELDRAVFDWFQERRSETVDRLLTFFTIFGGRTALVPLCLLAVVVLTRRSARRALGFLAFAAGTVALEVAGKRFFGRPRPLVEEVTDYGDLGFPSGHALASTALYGMLALVLYALAGDARARLAALGFGALMALCVAASRVYYAAHWPSDVVAGMALGLVYLTAVWRTGVFDPRRAP